MYRIRLVLDSLGVSFGFVIFVKILGKRCVERSDDVF